MEISLTLGLIGSFFNPHIALAQATTASTSPLTATTTPLMVLSPSSFEISSTSTNAKYIAEQAKLAGLDVQMVLYVASNESGFDTTKRGDGGTSRGIFQINNYWHSEVSDECAFSLKCATAWTLKTMKADGGCKQWSTCP